MRYDEDNEPYFGNKAYRKFMIKQYKELLGKVKVKDDAVKRVIMSL